MTATAEQYMTEAEKFVSMAEAGPIEGRPIAAHLAATYATMAVAAALLEQTAAASEAAYYRREAP